VGTPDGKGFTVATNGGIYVRGNYNTTTTAGPLIDATDGSTNTAAAAVINPAALMADQITVLSADWNNPSTQGNTDAAVNASHDPIDTKDLRTVTKNTKTTIAAGLLTGDTTAQNGYSVYSGGGDNLVRFLEDWNYNNSTGAIPDGATANFFGSFGRLFSSTVFTGQWQSPTGSTNMAYVYNHPVQRLYSFNDTLKSKPPPCSPNITVYNRGNFFNW
jgi:hypothetical protein